MTLLLITSFELLSRLISIVFLIDAAVVDLGVVVGLVLCTFFKGDLVEGLSGAKLTACINSRGKDARTWCETESDDDWDKYVQQHTSPPPPPAAEPSCGKLHKFFLGCNFF